MNSSRYTMLVLAFLFCLGSGAQTLPEFISTGLENNYKLKISRNEETVRSNNATAANAGYQIGRAHV